MQPVLLHSGPSAGLLVAAIGLGVVTVAVWNSIEVIGATERRALTVFGEYRQVLQPGISVVPPFVSRTYPFDMRQQRLELPAEELRALDGERFTVAPHVDCRVSDVEQLFSERDDYRSDLHRVTRRRLRDVVEGTAADTLETEPFRTARELRKRLERETRDWGLTVEDARLATVERIDE